MSEQPTNAYNPNEYRHAPSDGAVELNQQTDVWLKASRLPLNKAPAENAPVRELTEHERQILEIKAAAERLQLLNDERLRRQAA